MDLASLEATFDRLVTLAISQSDFPDDYLEKMESARQQQEQEACKNLELMAQEVSTREAERKLLWGNKFPRVLGQKPNPPVNPVKTPVKTRAKRAGRRRKVG